MSKSRLLAAGTILLAALVSAPAFAGGDSGFYLGAGVGQGSVDGDLNDGDDGFSFDGDDTAYKLIAGYNFGIIPLIGLAAEVEYVDFGKPEDGGAELDVSAFAAFGVVGVNLGPIGVFGKLGVASWDADVSNDSGFSDDGTDPAYGIGARFQIASFQIRAEYEYFDLDAADADLLSASLLYTF